MADKGIKVRNSLPAESGDDRTLRELIRKPHNLDEVKSVLNELQKGYLGHENMEIDSFFMVGVVGYNPQTGEFLKGASNVADQSIQLPVTCAHCADDGE